MAQGQPGAQQDAATVLYQEKQWVPWYWWIFGGLFVALTTAQLAHNRSAIWLFAPAIVLSALTVWALMTWSSTTVTVSEDDQGIRWLSTSGAHLPHTVVARSLAVPATAKRNALGQQLDPAAFVVSHGWVPEMAMLVIDDPEDDTPYWLIGSKDPEALLAAVEHGTATG